MRKAWTELGLPQQKEGAGGDAYGVFWLPSSQDPKTQTRSYGRTAHYDPVANRSNYHILVGHRVDEVILDERTGRDVTFKASGVKLQAVNANDSAIVVRSRHEVILAAGAVHTPGILQRSGIGPNNILKAANITTKVDLPGVGQNFQDHPMGNLFYESE
jgi:choline dehydrogenase-like flavoprotein